MEEYLQRKHQQWMDRVPVMSRYHKDYKEVEEDQKGNQIEEINEKVETSRD